MIAQTRAARRARIVEVLGTRAVRSQTELLSLLAQEGIEVTQATLSRDLDELGAERVRHGGGLVYAIPGEGGDRTPRAPRDPDEVSGQLARACADLLVTATPAANQVVLRTPPGAASYLAHALDQARWEEILGTIAGDDTILLVTADPSAADALATRLLRTADSTQTTTDDTRENQ